MKSFAFTLLALFLVGCEKEGSKPALVNLTCYDLNQNITARVLHMRGPVTMVDDPSIGYRSEKCVIERAD